MSKAIPLLPTWAFMDCSRVNFTFTFILVVCGSGQDKIMILSILRCARRWSRRNDDTVSIFFVRSGGQEKMTTL